MALTTSDIIHISTMGGFFLLSILVLFALYHARTCLPQTRYSTQLQISFLFGLVTSVGCIFQNLPESVAYRRDIKDILTPVYFGTYGISCLVFFLAQTEFFRSVTPVDQKRVEIVVAVARTATVVFVVIANVSIIVYFLTGAKYGVLQKIDLFGMSIIAIMDLYLNGYMVVTSLRRYQTAPIHLRLMLVVLWIVNIADFVAAVLLTSFSNFINGLDSGIGTLFLFAYPVSSYVCIVYVRKILIAKRLRRNLKMQAVKPKSSVEKLISFHVKSTKHVGFADESDPDVPPNTRVESYSTRVE